jgi:5-methylcytosine-specific restriction endonuclease McrA
MGSEQVPCPTCGLLVPLVLVTPPHYAEGRCPEHSHFWVPKPGTEKDPRRKASRKLLKLIEPERRTYCWRCLRLESALKVLSPPLFLVVHHVIEVKDGGSNEPINLQVLCAECHEETHRDRRRYGRYVSNGESKEVSAEEEPSNWDF